MEREGVRTSPTMHCCMDRRQGCGGGKAAGSSLKVLLFCSCHNRSAVSTSCHDPACPSHPAHVCQLTCKQANRFLHPGCCSLTEGAHVCGVHTGTKCPRRARGAERRFIGIWASSAAAAHSAAGAELALPRTCIPGSGRRGSVVRISLRSSSNSSRHLCTAPPF